MRKTYILCILLLGNIKVNAQFQLVGNSSITGINTYRITPEAPYTHGAIWNKFQHDLNKPFNLEGTINFGSIPYGADGMCFVFQNNCLAAGGAGGGLGYANMPGHSIAIEFDTYQNIAGTGAELNQDPTFDHIAVEKNGHVVHDSSSNALTNPIQIDPVLSNVKNGITYSFKISYSPATHLLEVYFNGSLRVSLIYDLKTNVFGGNPLVYWGFTGSTGSFYNEQIVSIDVPVSTFVIKDTSICTGNLPVNLNPFTNLKGTNLALNNPVVASTNFNGNNANLVVDGSLFSRWESNHGVDPQWLYVDLQTPADIDSVVLYWEPAYADQYLIQTSTDAISWNTAYSTTTGDGGKDKIIFSASNVRYVRMYGQHRATIYGYSLWEFQIYGLPKYLWSPNDGSISPDIYSTSVILNPTTTTTYSIQIPDACLGFTNATFTVTRTCALSLNPIYLDLTYDEEFAHLSWIHKETESGNYLIYKSTDGSTFDTLALISKTANELQKFDFSYFDTDKIRNKTYYRVEFVRNNMVMSQSKVKSISKNTVLPYVLQPVFENETQLILPPTEETELNYTIYSMLGQKVYTNTITKSQENIFIGGQLTPATYIVSVSLGNTINQIKCTKTK